MTGEKDVVSHEMASGEIQPALRSTAATQAPAEMPGVEEIEFVFCTHTGLQFATEADRARLKDRILDLFASRILEAEARALAAEAALKLVAEQDVTEIALDPDWPRRICAAAIRAQGE